eukprot:6637002-Prorocentrum_lima.AAC.1
MQRTAADQIGVPTADPYVPQLMPLIPSDGSEAFHHATSYMHPETGLLIKFYHPWAQEGGVLTMANNPRMSSSNWIPRVDSAPGLEAYEIAGHDCVDTW